MSPHRAVPQKKKAPANRTWLVAAGIAVVAILVIAVAASILAQPAPSTPPAAANVRSKGNAQARVAIVEYSDFQ